MGEDRQRPTLRKYLLGELSEAERSRLADQYFVDENLFDELLDVENEVLDQYARDQLSPSEMKNFRDYLASLPDGTGKLATAFALKQAGNEIRNASLAPVLRSRWELLRRSLFGRQDLLQYASVVILIALLCGIGYLLVTQRTLRNQIEQLRAEQIRTEQERTTSAQQAQLAQENIAALQERNHELETQLKNAQNETAPGPALAVLVLTPALRSGNTPDSIILTSSTRTVLLVTPVTNDAPDYSVILQTTAGKLVLTKKQLRSQASAQGKTVSLRLSAKLLTDSTYKLTLQSKTADGIDLAEDFYFNIIRK